MQALVEEWGAERIEDTLIFIRNAKDHRGLALHIDPTPGLVEALLMVLYDPS